LRDVPVFICCSVVVNTAGKPLPWRSRERNQL
jgi:hypothetical protein